MSDDSNKLETKALGNVMRFIKNGDDYREEFAEVEVSDRTDAEVEIAYTLGRDRYYVRLRTEEWLRLIAIPPAAPGASHEQ